MVTREQDLLKPALAHGALRFIGATTLDGYRQYIEKDAALERRFQQILVSGPQLPPAPRRSKTCRSRETAPHVPVSMCPTTWREGSKRRRALEHTHRETWTRREAQPEQRGGVPRNHHNPASDRPPWTVRSYCPLSGRRPASGRRPVSRGPGS